MQGGSEQQLHFSFTQPKRKECWWLRGAGGTTSPLLASLSLATSKGTDAMQDATQQPLGSLLIQKQLPGGFVAEQRTCEAVISSYHSQNEEFPRPCPVCNSSKFFLDSEGQRASVSGRPPAFSSRPWSCEQCSRFFHLGCLGLNSMDDVPAKPWYHSQSCRLMFLKLEDLAEQGEIAVPFSPPQRKSGWPSFWPWARRSDQMPQALGIGGQMDGHGTDSSSNTTTDSGYTCSFMTDVDQRTYLSQGPQRAPLPVVYDMLADVFPGRALIGFGNPALEYSAGKYACLCCKDGVPVACTTFNVHGNYAAQMHLLMTAPNARGKGHTRALVAALEENLKKLGVPQLLIQPRKNAIGLFTSKLGFDVMHPASAEVLWRRVPIAYTDSVILGKDLTCD